MRSGETNYNDRRDYTNFNGHFSICSITKIVQIAIIATIHSTSSITATRRIITVPSVITLSVVPVSVTHAGIIATAVVIIAVDVDARGVGVGRCVVQVALAVDVVLAGAAVGRSEVAIVIRVSVAVHQLTRVDVTGISHVGAAEISPDFISTFIIYREA